MAKYIEKEKVINELRYNNKVTHYSDDKCEDIVYKATREMQEVVFKIPAADVQPVKRGRWIEKPTVAYCSCCHVHWTKSFITSLRKTYKFCPNCGAKMDGGADNENS